MKKIDINNIDLEEVINEIEDNKEDLVIILKDGKPIAQINPYHKKDFFGCAKGFFTVFKDFDEMNTFEDFNSKLFPN